MPEATHGHQSEHRRGEANALPSRTVTLPASPARNLGIALALLSATTGCDCREPTEMERLTEQVGTTKTTIYLGAKVALAGDAEDDDVRDARIALGELLAEAEGARDGDDLGERTARAARESLAIARAGLALRRLGQRELEHFPEATQASFMALASDGSDHAYSPEAAAREHTLLAVLLTAAKLHPRSPVPVPAEPILYEVTVVDAEALGDPAIEYVIRAARGYAYGAADYCDLASQETAWLAGKSPVFDARAMTGLGRFVAHAGQAGGAVAALILLPPALHLGAHAQTAACYRGRGDDEAFQRELRHMLRTAEAWGVPETELALVRAYLAHAEGDQDATRAHLSLASTSPFLDDEGRRDILALRDGLSEGDGLMDDYFDQAFFVTWATRIILRRLDEAGAFDALRAHPTYRRLLGILETVQSAVETAESGAEGLLDGARQQLGCAAR